MSFFCCLASFLLGVWFCIYTWNYPEIPGFCVSKSITCAQTINEWRKWKCSVVLLRRQVVSRQNIWIRLLLFLVFIVWRQFFFFALFLRDKFCCFYRFLWTFWLEKECSFHRNIYIQMESSVFSLTKYGIIL